MIPLPDGSIRIEHEIDESQRQEFVEDSCSQEESSPVRSSQIHESGFFMPEDS